MLRECHRRHGLLPWTTPIRLTLCSPCRHYNRVSRNLSHRRLTSTNRAKVTWPCCMSSLNSNNTVQWAPHLRPALGSLSYRVRTKQVWRKNSTISPSLRLKGLGLLKTKVALCTHCTRMPLWLLTQSKVRPYLIRLSEIIWIIATKTYSRQTSRPIYRIRIERLMNNSRFLLIINSLAPISLDRHLSINKDLPVDLKK